MIAYGYIMWSGMYKSLLNSIMQKFIFSDKRDKFDLYFGIIDLGNWVKVKLDIIIRLLVFILWGIGLYMWLLNINS